MELVHLYLRINFAFTRQPSNYIQLVLIYLLSYLQSQPY
jgi:hypothetical protein